MARIIAAARSLWAESTSVALKDMGIPATDDQASLKEADSTKMAELLRPRDSAPDAFAQWHAMNGRRVKHCQR
jgi:hypothetical protein